MIKSLILGGISALLLNLPSVSQTQIPTNLSEIPSNLAQKQPTIVKVIPGQVSSIHFEDSEFISYVILSDSSRYVYTLNAPTDSGAAKSIFIRRIKPLNFPGEITTNHPNLFIVTNSDGGRTQNQYEFFLEVNTENPTDIVIFRPEIPTPKPSLVIETELGTATIKDIRLGLKIKFHKEKLDPSDPIVLAVGEILALAQNSEDQTLISLAQEYNVPLSFLTELGRIGLAATARGSIFGDSLLNHKTQN